LTHALFVNFYILHRQGHWGKFWEFPGHFIS
jgi:hypothetical protein